VSFPRYEKYKDSGVEWLGEVPSHWDVKAIKWISPVFRGASPRPIEDPKYFDDEGEFAWVRIADVSASDGFLRQTTQQLSELGSSLSVKIYPGELFVSIAGTVGKPCISKIKACIHDGFVYFPKLAMDPGFFYRIFESGTCYGGLGKFGTQLNLNTDTIGSIRVAIPPVGELTLLLEFLDRETSKIDALVSEQRRLIELLQEKRQATISHAVTKGLNPNAPMRDSGVEWLGQVPSHWIIIKIKQVTSRIGSGKTPSGGSETYENEGILFIRSQNVYDEGLFLDDVVYISEDTDKSMAYSRVLPLDILLNITGASIGRTCVVPEPFVPANVNQHVCVVRLKEQKNVPFVGWFFKSRSIKTQVDLAQTGAAREGLNFEQIGNLVGVLPPTEEQEAIVAFLDEETRKLDGLVAEAQRAIELLQERRTALISAAVTGKIDVRGFVGSSVANA
jgi:type I restriction enzyme S subunit